MSNILSGPCETKVSKKGMEPSVFGVSWVNSVCWSMELMLCRNWMLFYAFWVTKVSFTYLSHSLGGLMVELMTLVSNSSMNKLVNSGADGRSKLPLVLVHNTSLGRGVFGHNSNSAVMYLLTWIF